MSNEQMILVPKSRYLELISADLELIALYNAGIDNWDGVEEAREDLGKQIANARRELEIELSSNPANEFITQLARLHRVCERALSIWGHQSQSDVAMEECGELITSIIHCRRIKCPPVQVAHEAADVILMGFQMLMSYGGAPAMAADLLRGKIDSLIERIDYA